MPSLRPLIAAAALAGLAFTATGAAQQATFRASTRTVPIYATVTDANGRLVPDLERGDFEVCDNGRKQDLTLFNNVTQPISVVVMLDTSGSMTMHLDLLKQAATQFVIRLLPEDRARVGSFSDRNKIRIAPDEFTGDRDELMRAVREDLQFGNPTALWDAIGLRSRVRGQGVTQPDRGLRRVADEAGGGYFELQRTDELDTTFTRVAQELHSQYVLGFSPQTLDGKVHTLEVRATRPGLTTRARKSYVAK
ncbi:MAG: VWA domain-containing protein [Acidimicrobiia bacterium]|nr:VWA domain-containing protein [Acidimicrobiia bacterium]